MRNDIQLIQERTAPAFVSEYTGIESRPRVLIVDDDESIRGIFADSLAEKYDCTESGTVLEAFTLLSANEFALVITDVLMPGLSGVELLRRIIDSYPDTAVIMVSGVNNPQRALDAIRVGAFDYLIKPCDLDVLELTVERAMRRREITLDARRYKRELEQSITDLRIQKAELQNLQTQVIHNKKMASLGQLAAGVAHELNNPAGFIHGNMALFSQYVEELNELLMFYDEIVFPAGAEEKIAEIKARIDYEKTIEDLSSIIEDCLEGSRRIKEIVLNLRVFTRLDEAEFQMTDVHQGIDSTIRLLSSYFGSGLIQLSREYAQLPLIEAFPGQLNQVWMNLLVNGAQALGTKGGHISIATSVDNDFVTVRFQDSGPGIPSDILEQIFDPFFTTKPVGEGTGLGLSICFSIISKHGGTINVESSKGVGTIFTVRLPITAPAPETGFEMTASKF
jgi:signal transduction histidine kinase